MEGYRIPCNDDHMVLLQPLHKIPVIWACLKSWYTSSCPFGEGFCFRASFALNHGPLALQVDGIAEDLTWEKFRETLIEQAPSGEALLQN